MSDISKDAEIAVLWNCLKLAVDGLTKMEASERLSVMCEIQGTMTVYRGRLERAWQDGDAQCDA